MIRKIIAISAIATTLAFSPAFASSIGGTTTTAQKNLSGQLASIVQSVTNGFWSNYVDDMLDRINDPTLPAPTWRSFAELGITLPDGITVDDIPPGTDGNTTLTFRFSADPWKQTAIIAGVSSFIPLARLKNDTLEFPLIRPGTALSAFAMEENYARRDGRGPDGTFALPTFNSNAAVTFGDGASLIFASGGTVGFANRDGIINGVANINFGSGMQSISKSGNDINLTASNINIAGNIKNQGYDIYTRNVYADYVDVVNLRVTNYFQANTGLFNTLSVTGNAVFASTPTIAGRAGTEASPWQIWTTRSQHSTTAERAFTADIATRAIQADRSTISDLSINTQKFEGLTLAEVLEKAKTDNGKTTIESFNITLADITNRAYVVKKYQDAGLLPNVLNDGAQLTILGEGISHIKISGPNGEVYNYFNSPLLLHSGGFAYFAGRSERILPPVTVWIEAIR